MKGLHDRNTSILAKASKLYGQALVQLRDAIEDPLTCYDHNNISATMSLHLYETILYTSGLGWIQHAGGAGRLIELRGPERHQEWPDHGYFTLLRPRIIFQSIVSRKRTFLEREEWRTIPWAKHPETKTMHQQLLDIAAPISGIQEDWRKAKAIAEDRADLLQLCKRFIPRVRNLFETLFRWRWQWEADHPNCVQELPPDPVDTLSLDLDTHEPLFSTVYHFEDMTRANEINLYNTIFLILCHCSNIIHGRRNPAFTAQCIRDSIPEGDLPLKTNSLAFPQDCANFVQIADEIARTVDFCCQERHLSQGAFMLTIPLRMW